MSPEEAVRCFLSLHYLYLSILYDHSTNDRAKRHADSSHCFRIRDNRQLDKKIPMSNPAKRRFGKETRPRALPCLFHGCGAPSRRWIRCPTRRPIADRVPPPLQPLAPLHGSLSHHLTSVSIYRAVCKPELSSRPRSVCVTSPWQYHARIRANDILRTSCL